MLWRRRDPVRSRVALDRHRPSPEHRHAAEPRPKERGCPDLRENRPGHRDRSVSHRITLTAGVRMRPGEGATLPPGSEPRRGDRRHPRGRSGTHRGTPHREQGSRWTAVLLSSPGPLAACGGADTSSPVDVGGTADRLAGAGGVQHAAGHRAHHRAGVRQSHRSDRPRLRGAGVLRLGHRVLLHQPVHALRREVDHRRRRHRRPTGRASSCGARATRRSSTGTSWSSG